MCFVAPSEKCKLQVAEEDFAVYKIVARPKYKRYFWHPWDKYLAFVKSGIRGFIYKIRVLNKVIELAPIVDEYGRLIIEEGYHSYTSLTRARSQYSPMYTECIIKCIIPKGSYYYTYGDYCVSSNIIITDELCEKSE